jgi:hypothetical protein
MGHARPRSIFVGSLMVVAIVVILPPCLDSQTPSTDALTGSSIAQYKGLREKDPCWRKGLAR